EFRGSAARIEELPDELRRQVLAFRETRAGQFATRIFREHRPPLCNQQQLPKEPGLFARMWTRVAGLLFGRKLWVFLFAFGGKRTPMLRFGRQVLVNKHELVTAVLDRDTDFTIEEINRDKMAKLSVSFFLGMDRSAQHEREVSMTRGTVHKGDLDTIRTIVRKAAHTQVELARDFGRIDVVTSLAEVVLVRLVADYFGVTGPSEAAMKRWLRLLFWDMFLNPKDDEEVHQAGLKAASGLEQHLARIITSRRHVLEDTPGILADNLLNRMLRAQREPGNEWLDNDTVRRNISGLIIGALSTNAKAVVLVLDELLDRPEALREAMTAAQQDDIDTVHHYAFEALRFNPHSPGLLRFAEEAQSVCGPDGKSRKIKAKSTVYVGLSPAMFDPDHFPSPKKFDPTRDLKSYLHFGVGLHQCFGRHINAIVIPELCAAVLKLKDVRRGPGRTGRKLYEGPFPTNFVLNFG
ncbi:MAG: cytochrome P450, partial [Nannocystaceae bacterium]